MKDPKLDKLDSVSKRLKYLVDTMGIKQSHMADKLGLSPSGLHYILNNDVKFSKNAKKIAEYLNVSEEWLATGQGEAYEENTSVKTYKVPVYYPDQLKLYFRSSDQAKLSTDHYHITASCYSNQVLAIYMTDTGFIPKFEEGDVVVFEQISDFSDGEILLTYLGDKNAISLHYGFHVGDEVVLLSHHDEPIKLTVGEKDIIIGAYRECLKKMR